LGTVLGYFPHAIAQCRSSDVVRQEEARSAADDLLAAALLDEGWGGALQRLADAAEAGGASLVRLQGSRSVAQLNSTSWADAEAEMLAGGAPPSPLRFFPDHVFGNGFRVDHDVWTDDEMRRDPYYQQFLRPRGVFFHAKARLCSELGERLTLTLKRRVGLGPYEPADIAVLDSLLPELHATFRIARRVLDAEASGLVRALHGRGDPVFELDGFGRVLRVHGDGGERWGMCIRNRRLAIAERLSQPALDRAVAAAVRPPQRAAVAPLADQDGEQHYLHCVPVTGRARDVFLATVAVAAIIPARPRSNRGRLDPALLRDAFGLTDREAQVAALIGEGLDLVEIARRLSIDAGTARNHLKSVFVKSGTHRQAELVALLWRLSP
jgi:DNA-binding CsgD family transcriptional regulator